jgi:hypothetical protein
VVADGWQVAAKCKNGFFLSQKVYKNIVVLALFERRNVEITHKKC